MKDFVKFMVTVFGITGLAVLGYAIAPDALLGPVDDLAVAAVGAISNAIILAWKAGQDIQREALK